MKHIILSFFALNMLVLLLLTDHALGQVNRDSVVGPDSLKTSAKITAIPKMVDYGSDKCIPCKAMAPILKELREEYKGLVDVQFIDVSKRRDQATVANIRLIPTQVFYDTKGREIARHEGFLAKESILNLWRQYKMLPPEKK